MYAALVSIALFHENEMLTERYTITFVQTAHTFSMNLIKIDLEVRLTCKETEMNTTKD